MSRKGGKTSKKKKEKGQRIGRKREETVTISMRSGSASENEKEGQKNIFTKEETIICCIVRHNNLNSNQYGEETKLKARNLYID